MSDEIESSDDDKRIEKAVEVLSEYFDTVQIFCTRYEPGEDGASSCWQDGKGNWYARYGHIKCWLDCQDEKTKIQTREGLK